MADAHWDDQSDPNELRLVVDDEIAATVHAHFAGRQLRLFTSAYRQLGACPAAAIGATNDGGTVCPTCEGECVIPTCSDPACPCELDPPCSTRACPGCGGIGTV